MHPCYKGHEVIVLYLEQIPAPPLAGFVRSLWYAQVEEAAHGRERVLPNGCVQVILNLARDFLLDCPEGEADRPTAPAVIVGARSVYEIVSGSDMADLMGVVFEPGGFGCFAGDAAHLFSNRSVALEDVWGTEARVLRARLREISTPRARLALMHKFLLTRFGGRLKRNSMVEYALSQFGREGGVTRVREVAKQTGWSERRFSQVFREEVGLPPKVWCRIQRFQQAVRSLHTGGTVRWAELALDCGFYDQSHFANEFRAFSGIDVTTYSALRGRWANHIRVE
jgi:AraC-like DNA-binding protein